MRELDDVRNMNMVIFAVILLLVVLAILGILYGGEPASEDKPPNSPNVVYFG